MHRENENLFMKMGLPAQYSCHANKSSSKLKKFLLQNPWADIPETWYITSRTMCYGHVLKICISFGYNPQITFCHFFTF